MITNYWIAQNGKVARKVTGTFDEVIVIADNFAEQHRGDWIQIVTDTTPRQRPYTRCVDEGVREVTNVI
jgi:hypothetical protein